MELVREREPLHTPLCGQVRVSRLHMVEGKEPSQEKV